MRRMIWASVAASLLTAAALGGVGCGGGEKSAASANTAPSNGGAQGVVRSEIIEHEACDESGHRVESLDTNGDGKPDIKRIYDGNAELCRVSDMNHDGRPDMFEYFDKTGQIRRREIDFDDNGIANLIEHYENGKLVSRELDTTNQGRLDTWDTFDPATGKMIKRERDSTNDGRIDQWWTYDGDKVTIAMDRNGDGLPDPDATVVMGGDSAAKDAGVAPSTAPDAAAPAVASSASSASSASATAPVAASSGDSSGGAPAGASDAGAKQQRGNQ